ncbi:MAG: metallophosphoesterase [Acidobacteriaceae bacterium]|jgi:sphingomyelin phosphodiesterase acid-like 3
MQTLRRSLLSLLAACTLTAQVVLIAQSPAPGKAAAAAPAKIPALFLSDIHLDPFADPAKAARLNAASAAEWPAILSAPNSPTQAKEFAALQEACPTRGLDTNYVLWQSSLRAIHADAARARFITLSGDLLAHSFDCKFQTLLPAATHEDYLAFTVKTVRTIVATLRAALPGVPLYIAMGNNDSGCGDYQLDATHDAFLALVAQVVAEALPADLSAVDRAAVLRDFAGGGSYNVPLAAVPHTRLLVLDDLFFSGKYATCSGQPNTAPASAQLAWLAEQLDAAREHGERVWVMGHIPPGVNLYATARNSANVCAGARPQMFLANESLAELLARNADVVRLAIFGHTHADEMRLLAPEPRALNAHAQNAPGVPVKIVASITPINGNRPTFTLASIDPASATLVDYTVFMASNLTGVAAKWVPEYTYSTTYHKRAFDALALIQLIGSFQADPAAKSPASQATLRNYFPGDISRAIQFAWPQYACSLDHDSARSFSDCACAASK